jgi:general transcription factor 3C polypeptide 2
LEPVPKRPRGRPRKNPLPVAKFEDSSQNGESQDIILFDPLSTSSVVPDDLPLAYVMPTVKSVQSTPNKRGRGRPKKNPSDKLTGSSGTVLEDVCTAPAPTTAICTKPKRPRGRPRKYPIPMNNGSVSGADVELGKGTTCQPASFGCSLDDTACTEFNANLSIVAVDAALPLIDKLASSGTVSGDVCTTPSPTTAICTKPKKPRGRPRKYPVPINGGSVPITAICTKPKKSRGRPRKYPVPINGGSVSCADAELGQETSCQPVSLGSLDHTVCTEFNANLSIVPVDAALPVKESVCTEPSPATATRKQPKRTRVRPQKYSDTTIELGKDTTGEPVLFGCSMDHTACTESDSSFSIVAVEGNARKGALSDGSVLPIHISPKSSNKRESSGRRGRGRPKTIPLSAGTGRFAASGASLPMTTSVLTSPNNPTSLNKSGGKFIASSLGSCGCDIEKCSVHSGVLLSDDASPAHGLYNANCKEESNTKIGKEGSRKKPVSTEHNHFTDFNVKEQKLQTIPKSGDPVVLVENCMEGPGPRKARGQLQRIPASNESSGTSVGGETHKMEGLSTSMTKGPSKSDHMAHGAGLNQSKNAIVGCDGMEVNEGNTANYTSHCNENARENQVAPSFKNSDRVIDETEAAELVPLKESRVDDNMFSCVNSNSSSITRDIAQPRVVLCLAHNGRVAWDIKWKPPLLSQPEQKSRLGFLAVLLGNGTLEV